MIIRSVGIKDLEAVEAMVEILVRCKQDLGLGAELNWSRESILQAIERSKVIGVFPNPDVGLAAYIIYLEVATEGLDTAAEILVLATHPQYHGQGLMKALIGHLKQNHAKIWLEVHEANRGAREFYKSQGFQDFGLRKAYYRDGANAIMMGWGNENTRNFK